MHSEWTGMCGGDAFDYVYDYISNGPEAAGLRDVCPGLAEGHYHVKDEVHGATASAARLV